MIVAVVALGCVMTAQSAAQTSDSVYATPKNVQYVYTEASDLTLIGKIMDTPNPYHRVDTVKYKGFTKTENFQVRCPAGLAVVFRTNSGSITLTATGDFSWRSNSTMRLASQGYDLYIKLLNQAVLEERGEEHGPEAECTVNLDYDAFLPEKYVPFPAQRMALYKKIALIANEADLSDVTDELLDRFGEPPLPTRNLLRIALIHSTAVRAGMTAIRQFGEEIHIYPQKTDFDRWAAVADGFPGQLRVLMSGETHLCLRIGKKKDGLTLTQSCLDRYLATE